MFETCAGMARTDAVKVSRREADRCGVIQCYMRRWGKIFLLYLRRAIPTAMAAIMRVRSSVKVNFQNQFETSYRGRGIEARGAT